MTEFKSTDQDSVVSIRVSAQGAVGVVLEEGPEGKAAVIRAWEKVGGRAGMVERHGGVRLGDVLIGVNERPTAEMPFRQVVEVMQDERALKRILHFSSLREYQRRKAAIAGAPSHHANGDDFTSSVRRVRISVETSSQRKFAEYEIACALRKESVRLEEEHILKWSIWRRYSDFERLEAALKTSLGWHMADKVLPPKHTFVLDKFAPEFLEERRAELDLWWKLVIAVDRATDFHRHHCDPHLKSFVQAFSETENKETSSPPALPIPIAKVGRGRRRPTSLLRARNSLKKQQASSYNTVSKTPPSPSSPREAKSLVVTTLPGPQEADSNNTKDAQNQPPPADPQRAALLSQISSSRLSL